MGIHAFIKPLRLVTILLLAGCAPSGGGGGGGTASVTKATSTTVPTPTILVPSSILSTSSETSLTISGTCVSGNSVKLGGSAVSTTTCTGSAFSFSYTPSNDGTYTFSVNQTNSAGKASSLAQLQWIRDATAPAGPTVNLGSAYLSGDMAITIGGACETGATVKITGDLTATATCASSAYSFDYSSSADGTYNFSLTQTDPAYNTSSATSFQWTRNTGLPATPTITAPVTTPYFSNASSLTISGGCTSGLTVTIGGNVSPADITSTPGTLTTPCASSTYSFTISKTTDDSYSINIRQTSATGIDSAFATLIWNRDTVAPAAPTIVTPGSNPFTSGDTELTISGACETGATVNISGAVSGSVTCTDATYAFNTSESGDGTYGFSLNQTDTVGNSSASRAFQWTRDTSVPSTPTVTSPATSPYSSSASSVTVSGGCVTGNTVVLGGNVLASDVTSPSGSLTQVCASSAYSYTIAKSLDGAYAFSIYQNSPTEISSNTAYFTWNKDTVAPAAPAITLPTTSSYISGDTTLGITGTCESNGTVTISGDSSGTASCAAGTFSFSSTQTSDGTYTYSFMQTDQAGNTSASDTLSWTRDTTIPETPVFSSPSSSSYHSSGSSLTVTGSCVTDNTLTLGGDAIASEVTTPAGALTTTCVSSSFTFVIDKFADGAYDLNFTQTNATTDINSASANLVWTRDTTAPSAPTITLPVMDPYTSSGHLTLSGSCESGATVQLNGAESQTTTCAAGAYSFTTSTLATDGIYDFTVGQTDRAGNPSVATVSRQWIRNSTTPAAPTIVIPSVSPYNSNGASITVSGGCTTGYGITLSGDVSASDVTAPAGSLTTTCSGSAYSFVVAKSLDGTYTLRLIQTSLSGFESPSVSVQWNRDSTEPVTSILTKPSSTNLSSSATFTFSVSQAGSTSQCKLDSGTYATCTSPIIYSTLTNVDHTFYVKSIDPYGNVESTPQSYTWTQASYKAVALYHFDSGASTVDSGLYTDSNNNALLLSGGTAPAANTTASNLKFGTGSENFTSGYVAAADSPSLDLLAFTLTAEAFVNFKSLPATNTTYTILSKRDANNKEWALDLIRTNGNNHYLQFRGSLNGATETTIRSGRLNGLAIGTFYHLAVTWNKGTVQLYFNGSSKGTGTVGTAGVATLYNGSAKIRIGADETTNTYTNAYIDEVRISQIVRYTGSTYAVPASAFTAD